MLNTFWFRLYQIQIVSIREVPKWGHLSEAYCRDIPRISRSCFMGFLNWVPMLPRGTSLLYLLPVSDLSTNCTQMSHMYICMYNDMYAHIYHFRKMYAKQRHSTWHVLWKYINVFIYIKIPLLSWFLIFSFEFIWETKEIKIIDQRYYNQIY